MNYAYEVGGEVRRAINAVGLEPSVGFPHDFSYYQTKQSLVYDLQEPFRWLSDISVIEAFETEALKLSDFYFTGDDYRYHFETEAKQRFINLIRERFNAGVAHKGRVLKWDTVLEQKANELGRFLIGKSSKQDFIEPVPRLERRDDQEMRAKILTLKSSHAKDLGIGRSTLHNLRLRSSRSESLRIYTKTRRKLELVTRSA